MEEFLSVLKTMAIRSRVEGLFYSFLLCLANILYGLYKSYEFAKIMVERRLYKLRMSAVDMDSQLEINRSQLSKIPTHIAFLFLEKTFHPEDIANLIDWSSKSGIRYVSLYDPNNEIRFVEAEVKALVEQRMHKNRHKGFIWTSLADGSESVIPRSKNGRNGSRLQENDHTFRVTVLSEKNGIPALACAAKSIAEERRRNKNLADRPLTEEDVHEKLKVFLAGLPDPDVLLRFGGIESNVGFLPWQSRLTEMHTDITHRLLTPIDLINVLRKFSKCQQRFGK